MPDVDSSGKEFWSVDLDEWVYERGTGDENEWKPPVKGHMLHSTVEKDDDGNLYLVWTFADEDCWMIGKKERGWNMGIETEGDKRRLKLTDLLAEQVVPGGGGLPQVPIERDMLKEREKLGLERMLFCETRPDENYLLGSYRWIYSSANKHPWYPQDSWDSGLALFRNPSGGSKITGRLKFWSDYDNAEMRTKVGAISPSVDEEGKEIWCMTSGRWFGAPQRKSYGKMLLMDGHQMRFTAEKDDAGNPFWVVMLCWGPNHRLYNTPLTYSYLIGKRQNYRYGRLGFSADEYARLAYGRQSGCGFQKILMECQRLMKDME
ncbi:hypothetical protein NA56DRAFT_690125 [Hyaloscypha hepaticicola]|uniref:Uncharacterized protein n=1 Tax=Hyaloscypha hepaticicola TaxID=2082293 RepID=A0A2J6Q140_9HELO|nr:hypothetical protein NA56DRAFT_690125 [Hyaloscypha hepaticicola]